MAILSESEYLERATGEIKALLGALDQFGDDFEVELSSDILSVEFADGGNYVINSHTAARQIWMAAERRAWHFDYDKTSGSWIASKGGDELWQTLERVLSTKVGRKIQLTRSGH